MHILLQKGLDLLPTAANENDRAQENFAFKNNALFTSCISKINSTLIVNGKDLDIVMPVYNIVRI